MTPTPTGSSICTTQRLWSFPQSSKCQPWGPCGSAQPTQHTWPWHVPSQHRGKGEEDKSSDRLVLSRGHCKRSSQDHAAQGRQLGRLSGGGGHFSFGDILRTNHPIELKLRIHRLWHIPNLMTSSILMSHDPISKMAAKNRKWLPINSS